MPVKRSRIGRSLSLGEISFCIQERPTDPLCSEKNTSQLAIKRPIQKSLKSTYEKPEKSCRKILTIASPSQDSSVDDLESCVDANVGRFLEACYLCKKKIGESEEVFMYSYLRAFCSCKCRDQQIAIDNGKGKSDGNSLENAVLRYWERNLKGCLGDQKRQS